MAIDEAVIVYEETQTYLLLNAVDNVFTAYALLRPSADKLRLLPKPLRKFLQKNEHTLKWSVNPHKAEAFVKLKLGVFPTSREILLAYRQVGETKSELEAEFNMLLEEFEPPSDELLADVRAKNTVAHDAFFGLYNLRVASVDHHLVGQVKSYESAYAQLDNERGLKSLVKLAAWCEHLRRDYQQLVKSIEELQHKKIQEVQEQLQSALPNRVVEEVEGSVRKSARAGASAGRAAMSDRTRRRYQI